MAFAKATPLPGPQAFANGSFGEIERSIHVSEHLPFFALAKKVVKQNGRERGTGYEKPRVSVTCARVSSLVSVEL